MFVERRGMKMNSLYQILALGMLLTGCGGSGGSSSGGGGGGFGGGGGGFGGVSQHAGTYNGTAIVSGSPGTNMISDNVSITFQAMNDGQITVGFPGGVVSGTACTSDGGPVTLSPSGTFMGAETLTCQGARLGNCIVPLSYNGSIVGVMLTAQLNLAYNCTAENFNFAMSVTATR
jgi:hypothetical protein